MLQGSRKTDLTRVFWVMRGNSSSLGILCWRIMIITGGSSQFSSLTSEIDGRDRVLIAAIPDHRPSVKFFCDIAYDPFLVMQDQNKVYGFTISLFEYIETIPSLWDSVKGRSAPVFLARRQRGLEADAPGAGIDFIKKYPEHIPEGNGMKFLSDDGGETYNRCHCESYLEPVVTFLGR